MELQQLFTYSQNCRNLLQETLTKHLHVFESTFETTSNFPSIRYLLIHSSMAEEYCVQGRIQGKEIDRSKWQMPETINEAFTNWDRVRADTLAFYTSLDQAGLQKIITVYPDDEDQSITDQMSVEQILFHVLAHEIHHRAQISMALQQANIEPPNFDYLFLHRAQSNAQVPV